MSLHIAITRRVKPGREAEFQEALREFFQASFSHGGVLGATMLVPPPGSNSREFGILRTFVSEKERADFYASPVFKAWEERCRPLTDDSGWSSRDLHGLEAWFRQPDLPPPPRWRMAVATLLGVYPTSLLLGKLLAPHLGGMPEALVTLLMGACMVVGFTWAVMPLVTKLLHHWLHPQT